MLSDILTYCLFMPHSLYSLFPKFAGFINSPPEQYAEFLKVLSTNSPVCGAFHYKHLDLMSKCMNGNILEDSQLLKELQTHIPVMFRLMSHIQGIPNNIKLIVAEIINKVKSPFMNLKVAETPVPITEDKLAFFPSLEKVRTRGFYSADHDKGPQICTKKGTRHPVLLPGIFTVFCAHGKFIPPQILFGGGEVILFSRCPSIHLSVQSKELRVK